MWVGEGPSRQSRTERDGPVRSGKEMVRPGIGLEAEVRLGRVGQLGWERWRRVGAWAGNERGAEERTRSERSCLWELIISQEHVLG